MVKYGWPFIGIVMKVIILQAGVNLLKMFQGKAFVKICLSEIRVTVHLLMISMVVIFMTVCSF